MGVIEGGSKRLQIAQNADAPFIGTIKVIILHVCVCVFAGNLLPGAAAYIVLLFGMCWKSILDVTGFYAIIDMRVISFNKQLLA